MTKKIDENTGGLVEDFTPMHTHAISEITGLVKALAAKQAIPVPAKPAPAKPSPVFNPMLSLYRVKGVKK